MTNEPGKQIGSLTVPELKDLIKECIREAEEKQFTDAEYKALWIKSGRMGQIERHGDTTET